MRRSRSLLMGWHCPTCRVVAAWDDSFLCHGGALPGDQQHVTVVMRAIWTGAPRE